MKKLPRYPVPVFLLAQLAVHSEYHNSGDVFNSNKSKCTGQAGDLGG